MRPRILTASSARAVQGQSATGRFVNSAPCVAPTVRSSSAGRIPPEIRNGPTLFAAENAALMRAQRIVGSAGSGRRPGSFRAA
jgi:hypothetical protein